MPVMSNRPGRVVIRDASPANGAYVVLGNTAASNVAYNTENVAGLHISKISWSTNGSIDILRGANVVIRLHGAGEWELNGMPISSFANATLNVNFTSSGSIVLEASKVVT